MSRDQPGVVELPAAGVPADQGLSSLGLIMQLGGTVAGLGVALFAFGALLTMRAAHGESLWMFLLLSTCVVRSLFHRMAGTDLLYARPHTAPLAALQRYILIGLGHSALFAVVLKLKFDAPAAAAIGLGVGLAVWPAILAVLLVTGSFRRFTARIPVAEDKGFEGAAILMAVLGICGTLAAASVLLAMFEAGGRVMREGRVVLIMLAVILLLVRSVLHARAGISGIHTTSIDRSVEHANRYSSFGIVSAFCAGGAMLLGVMTTQLDVSMLAAVTAITWMLMAWPLIVRRFFGERQFADLLAGEQAEIHRRAPDAGLTCLGWLLVAHAACKLTFALPGIIGDTPANFDRVFALLDGSHGRSPWWNVGIAMMELWAGYELIRMTALHRYIASGYAVVASAVTLYLSWPVLRHIQHLTLKPQELAALMPIAIALVIPAAALVLVNRKIAPTARARFKVK